MNCILTKIPSLNEAQYLLDEAKEMNPGPWYRHSLNAGMAAEIIAENCIGMDPYAARVMGMLHDIGRRFGKTGMRHIIDGYNFMMDKGYESIAKVCMTHSFNFKDIEVSFGKWDCNEQEYNFVKDYLSNVEYDDYDLLIQLCDALALPEGYCLMEKRMVDVAMRYGIHERIIDKWEAAFETKKYFDRKAGRSIYSLLPGVVENTFDINSEDGDEILQTDISKIARRIHRNNM